MATLLGVGSGGGTKKSASTDTAVVRNENTVVERKKAGRITLVSGGSCRDALQHSWDLKIFFFGALFGLVPAAAMFFLIARGMYAAGNITGGVAFAAVLGSSQFMLLQLDALRDKLSVARTDEWFYVGLCMLGAPLGIALGLWLG